MYYGGLYSRDTLTGNSAANADKEKALSFTHEALKKAPLSGRADLAMVLERLGQEEEALPLYEDFLKEAQHTPPPTNQAANALVAREMDGDWQGLIAMVQTRADLLKKNLAEKPQSP